MSAAGTGQGQQKLLRAHTKNTLKNGDTVELLCRLCLCKTVAREHTAKTTVDGKVACTLCACIRGTFVMTKQYFWTHLTNIATSNQE